MYFGREGEGCASMREEEERRWVCMVEGGKRGSTGIEGEGEGNGSERESYGMETIV